MERKVKIIIIVLIAILGISLFLNLSIYSAKQTVERDRNRLDNENAALRKDVNDKTQNIRRLEEKVVALNQDLDKADKAREEIQKNYELVNNAKAKLIEQIEFFKARMKTEKPQAPQQGMLPAEDAYWAGVLKAKTDLEFQLESIRSELKNTQINNEQLQREKNTLELDIKNLNREKEDLRRQIEYNQKILNSIAQEVVRERNDKFKIQDSLKTIKAENVLLRRQLRSLVSRKINLEKKLQELKDANAGLENRFTEMGTLLKDKVAKISELKDQLDAFSSGGNIDASAQKKETVELPPIVVRPQPEQPETALQEEVSSAGTIIGINKDNNFVIIDLGADRGVKEGDTFQVYNEGQDKAIATIEAIQVRKSISACDIKQETTPIKVGDTVR